jgi:lipid-binding SYLF domain-containing protein
VFSFTPAEAGTTIGTELNNIARGSRQRVMARIGKESGMKSVPVLITVLTVLAILSPTAARTEGMQAEIDRAAAMYQAFQADPQPVIPKKVLGAARGLAFITVFRLAPHLRSGFILTGPGSKGIVAARTGQGWSAPCAVATGSAAYGAEIGEEVAEYILVINSNDALSALSSGLNVTLGTDVTIAAGPRKIVVGATPPAAVYYYGRSEDPSMKTSPEGVSVAVNAEENTVYYNRPVSAQSIFSGLVTPPAGAEKLLKMLKDQ